MWKDTGSALKGTGLDLAVKKVVAAAKNTSAVGIKPVFLEGNKGEQGFRFTDELEKAVAEVEEKFSDQIPQGQKRFFAIKLLERDEQAMGRAEWNKELYPLPAE